MSDAETHLANMLERAARLNDHDLKIVSDALRRRFAQDEFEALMRRMSRAPKERA